MRAGRKWLLILGGLTGGFLVGAPLGEEHGSHYWATDKCGIIKVKDRSCHLRSSDSRELTPSLFSVTTCYCKEGPPSTPRLALGAFCAP